ncbi:Hypothetical predicted protein [Octopus vulgaris]|uniref:Uncharacterized protein n=1 Tax=Octopus vulgaris TaxID=6645 RepID=A0AA36F2S0_OCTVU|nr:Hypothetical predicted protein [Octopus vulgaris]
MRQETKMKHALQKPVDGKPKKRASINPESAGQKQLQDFVTANTKRFFEILEVPCTFLEKDAEEWNDDESYANARDIAYGLKEKLKIWAADHIMDVALGIRILILIFSKECKRK